MFSNFLTVALRKIARNKMAALVNILGLSMGLSCTIIIAVLLRFELSFDNFHPKKDRLYKVVTDEIQQGRSTKSSGSPGGMAEALLKDFPGVEQATVAYYEYAGLFTVRQDGNEKKFQEDEGVVLVQSPFFEMLDIPFLAGIPQSIDEPRTAVLTQSVASRYFGNDPPVGKTIRWGSEKELKIVGVVPDPPKNTHIKYSVLISGAELKKTDPWMYDWRNLTTNVQTFVLLREGAAPESIESQFPRFKDLYLQESVDEKIFHLQPVNEAHFNPEYSGGIGRTVSFATLTGLAIIGLFLILTACVNFVNMATAQAATRAREVGVRKVLGAIPRHIRLQFLGETFLIVLMSLAVAIMIAEVVTPILGSRLDIPLELTLTDPVMIGFIAALALTMTLLSGLYPAFILAGFLPAPALKGSVSAGGLKLRRVLVVLQFAISQMLIIGTLVVAFQMDHLLEQDMGLNPEGVIVVPIPNPEKSKLEAVKNELLSRPQIRFVSFSWNSAISGNVWNTNIYYQDGNEEKILTTDLKFADENYLDTYGIKLLTGRNYHPSDTVRELLVNEKFIQGLGIKDPRDALGKMVRFRQSELYPIVGVVKDFNLESLHEVVNPCLLTTRTNRYYEGGVRIQASDIQATISHLEQVWSKTFPEFLFEYEFLDERIASFYEQERRVAFLFQLFSSIAIVIGCIGLVGLISFVAVQKTKEIGVRKVLGASVASILLMFSKEFLGLILVAFVLAVPVSYVVMNKWLEDFAYRISLGPTVFLVAALTTVVLAALTIGYRAIRAATANPVEALKYE